MHVHACMHAWGPSWCTFRILIHICMQFVHDDRSGSWSWSFRIHMLYACHMHVCYAEPLHVHSMHDDPDPDPLWITHVHANCFFQSCMIFPSYDPRATSALYSLIKFTSATTASRNSTANLFIHSFQESGIQVPELVQRYKKTLYKSASGHGSPNSIFWKTSRSLCPWMDVALLLQTAL